MVEKIITVKDAINSCSQLRDKLVLSIMYNCAATNKAISVMSYEDFNIQKKTLTIGPVCYELEGDIITLLSEYVAETKYRNGLLFRSGITGTLSLSHIGKITFLAFRRAYKKRVEECLTAALLKYPNPLSRQERQYLRSVLLSLEPWVTPKDIRNMRIEEWKDTYPMREVRRLAQMHVQ